MICNVANPTTDNTIVLEDTLSHNFLHAHLIYSINTVIFEMKVAPTNNIRIVTSIKLMAEEKLQFLLSISSQECLLKRSRVRETMRRYSSKTYYFEIN